MLKRAIFLLTGAKLALRFWWPHQSSAERVSLTAALPTAESHDGTTTERSRGAGGGAKCAVQDAKGAVFARTRLFCSWTGPSWQLATHCRSHHTGISLIPIPPSILSRYSPLLQTSNWNSDINLRVYHKTYLFPTLDRVWIPVSSVTLLSPLRDFLPALICALWTQTAGVLCTMEKLKLIWSVWRLGPIVMLWCHGFTG